MLHHIAPLPAWKATTDPRERARLARGLGGQFCKRSGSDALLVHGTERWDVCVLLARHLAQRDDAPMLESKASTASSMATAARRFARARFAFDRSSSTCSRRPGASTRRPSASRRSHTSSSVAFVEEELFTEEEETMEGVEHAAETAIGGCGTLAYLVGVAADHVIKQPGQTILHPRTLDPTVRRPPHMRARRPPHVRPLSCALHTALS